MTAADGQTFTGDYLVLAAGSRPNFFHTPGAEEHAFPLYTVEDAEALRTRLFEVFEAADNDPARIDEGALNIVIVGAGRPPVAPRSLSTPSPDSDEYCEAPETGRRARRLQATARRRTAPSRNRYASSAASRHRRGISPAWR